MSPESLKFAADNCRVVQLLDWEIWIDILAMMVIVFWFALQSEV